MTLNESIRIAKKECKNAYAQSYLNAIPEAIELEGTHALKIQLLYVLNNCQYWRGDTARQVKTVWKSWIAQH